MPEGHTIHRLARELTRDLVGGALAVSSPQGRAAATAALLERGTLARIDPYGKHLFLRWKNGLTLHVHLGMYGKFHRFEPPGPEPRPTVRLRLAGERLVVDLIGPTVCALIEPGEEARLRGRLGPDPLARGTRPELAWERLRRRRTAVGAALLDQSVLAGVGNVYRAEALFVHGIDPCRPASTLTREEFDALWATLAGMLRHGVRDGRIITVDPTEFGYRRRSRIPPEQARYVYRQPFCRRCRTPVDRFLLAGRWAYRCPHCQPRL